jgi:hypothetical protein
MAFGDGQGRPVIVPNQPLVTSAEDVVNPAAVQNLVDSFRQGSITAQDIYDRIGPVGQAKKKAALEQLSEFVDPAAIEARKAEIAAGGAQAQLQTAQAGAQGTLVPAQTELAAAALQQQKADLLQKHAIDAYTSWNPPIYKHDSDGNETTEPDYQKMAKEGIHYVRAQNMLGLAQQGLAGQWVEEADPKTGQKRRVFRNANGEDVSPVPGNKAFEFYQQMRRDAYEVFHREPDTTPSRTAVPAPAEGGPAPTPSIVEPIGGSPEGNARRAQLATLADSLSPGASAAPAANSSIVIPNTITAAPAAAPVINPGYVPGTGISSGLAPGQFNTPVAIAEDLHKQKAVEALDTQKSFANSFDTAVQRINSIPPSEQRTGKAKMNALDISLAESIIKMYDPGAALREFKWDKLTEAQPYLEKLPNWRAEFLHTGALTPEGRQRLIEMGYDVIDGKEKAALPHIQQAARRAASTGVDLDQVLNPDEQRVLAGQKFGTNRAGTTQAPAPPGGKRANYKGKPGWVTPDGYFHPDA